nr:tetratricopeptide repeat protein [Anaerolineae bacterium]
MDSRTDRALALIRRRWPLVLLVIGAPLVLAPHPAFDPLVQSMERASIAFGADRPGAAAEALSRALIMEPHMPEIRRLAVEAALSSGDPDLALKLLDPPIGTDELEAPCLRFEAEFLRAGPTEAARMTREIPQGCPPDTERLSKLAQETLATGDHELAEVLQRSALRVRPDDPHALEALAVITAL